MAQMNQPEVLVTSPMSEIAATLGFQNLVDVNKTITLLSSHLTITILQIDTESNNYTW